MSCRHCPTLRGLCELLQVVFTVAHRGTKHKQNVDNGGNIFKQALPAKFFLPAVKVNMFDF